jgi:hypothetical protein
MQNLLFSSISYAFTVRSYKVLYVKNDDDNIRIFSNNTVI